jgi:HlyD family secretion protein
VSEAASNFAVRAVRAAAFARSPRGLAAAGALLAALLLVRACGAEDEVAYETASPQRGSLAVKVTATGTLQPINQVDIGSELSGTIRTVAVDFNDVVRKNQEIARLDTTRLDAQVLQSQAAHAAALANVDQARASQREAEAKLARLERVHEMSGGKVPSAAELDVGRANAARALADVASARAAAAQAKATLDAQRTDLGKASIRSPIDGIVLKRAIEPGQTVAAAMQAPILFTLAEDLTHMELLVSVDEADVSAVAEKQRATFTVDAWPGRVFDAEVVQVRYGADALEGVVTYGALLRVENPERRLRPGMTATAEIEVKRVADALLVPNAALRFSPPSSKPDERSSIMRFFQGPPRTPRKPAAGNGRGSAEQTVYRLEDGELIEVPVTIGATDGNLTEIVAGELALSDALVVELALAKP